MVSEKSGEGFAAANPELRSALGHTLGGEPLSNNRAPADDLAPWVARVYATKVEMDPGETMVCGLIADTPVMRVLLGGEWTARTRDGAGRYGPSDAAVRRDRPGGCKSTSAAVLHPSALR